MESLYLGFNAVGYQIRGTLFVVGFVWKEKLEKLLCVFFVFKDWIVMFKTDEPTLLFCILEEGLLTKHNRTREISLDTG